MPYFSDNFIPGINAVPERRNNAIKGIIWDKFITPSEVVINRYSRDKSAKTRWPDAPNRGVLGFLMYI